MEGDGRRGGGVRVFLAVRLDQAVVRRLEEVMAELSAAGADVKWVEPENLHLTLHFLGEVGPGALAGVHAALGEAAGKIRPFRLQAQGCGAFPAPARPRVVWAGVRAEAGLQQLHGRLAARLAGLGLPVENRPYRPHITLGRVRSARGAAELAGLIAAHRDGRWGETLVREAWLLESRLGRRGPQYLPLAVARLGDAG